VPSYNKEDKSVSMASCEIETLDRCGTN